ncbi:vWA domain-containing protein [Calycomorphotria hydatis]|uniref:VWFA domain-containing protein n=1 Tax=Calycomorphotria hydatis TaxID=2528027 RepID=A0A517T9F0_9PLAN|nr:hypothetical protein [Calycomorphotria hydatis]QDT65004.1 hypothetical protein V22_22500 [Calycomorphotria hydatis]
MRITTLCSTLIALGCLLSSSNLVLADQVDADLFTAGEQGTAGPWAVVVPANKALKSAAVNHHIVLVDTSASQVGEFRNQSLRTLEQFCAALPSDAQVRLNAYDLNVAPLTNDFVAANEVGIATAIQLLKKRTPLGASNLERALKEAIKQAPKGQPVSITLIGDGTSSANLMSSEDVTALLNDLREHQIFVNTVPVGSRPDFQLLGILSYHTGGVLTNPATDDKSTEVGETLANAATTSPSWVKVSAKNENGLITAPNAQFAFRPDRETVLLGNGKLPAEIVCQPLSSDNHAFKTAVDETVSNRDHLVPLVQSAERSNGLITPVLDRRVLNVQAAEFEQYVGKLIEAGETAVRSNDRDTTKRIVKQVSDVAPNRNESKAFVRLASQFFPPKPADGNNPPAPADGAAVDNQANVNAAAEDNFAIRAQQRARVLGKQLALTVSQALEQARALRQSDVQGAISDLKQLKTLVESVTDVPKDLQEQLLRQINEEIQVSVNVQERNEIRQIEVQERLAAMEAEQRIYDRLILEEEKMEQLIERVRSLLIEGRAGNDSAYPAAEAVAVEAVNLSPGSGVATSARFVTEAAYQLNRAFRLRELRADRFLETLHMVETSHVPFPDEPPIRYPAPEIWKALTERRKRYDSVSVFKESPNEERIRAALEEQTRVEFPNTPLRDAIEFLADYHNITILIDESALLQEGIDSDVEIDLVLDGITLRSAMRLMLKPLNLTYIIEDEVMKITTQTIADETLSTRVYPVGDLVIPISTPLGAGIGQGLGGSGGFNSAGGLGAGGQFGQGAQSFGQTGGGGGGGGFFSVPAEKVPADVEADQKIEDPELNGLLDDILEETAESAKKK